ncbi:MAG TPA: hypothetical protein PKA88_35070, partial [Polyangiaceae bacterium]|nr:hypothetical protein [Polyangiaceae bacterium]
YLTALSNNRPARMLRPIAPALGASVAFASPVIVARILGLSDILVTALAAASGLLAAILMLRRRNRPTAPAV